MGIPILFGTYKFFSKAEEANHIQKLCPECHGKLDAGYIRKVFHLMFIPLIPGKKHKGYKCQNCGTKYLSEWESEIERDPEINPASDAEQDYRPQ